MKKVNTTVKLGLPPLMIASFFLIPYPVISIPLWICAVICLILALKEKIKDTEKIRTIDNILIFIDMYILGIIAAPFAIIYFLARGIKKTISSCFQKFGNR